MADWPPIGGFAEREAAFTRATVCAELVVTHGVGVARVRSFDALVDVRALHSVTTVTVVAVTRERPGSVRAGGVRPARTDKCPALVDVCDKETKQTNRCATDRTSVKLTKLMECNQVKIMFHIATVNVQTSNVDCNVELPVGNSSGDELKQVQNTSLSSAGLR